MTADIFLRFRRPFLAELGALARRREFDASATSDAHRRRQRRPRRPAARDPARLGGRGAGAAGHADDPTASAPSGPDHPTRSSHTDVTRPRAPLRSAARRRCPHLPSTYASSSVESEEREAFGGRDGRRPRSAGDPAADLPPGRAVLRRRRTPALGRSPCRLSPTAGSASRGSMPRATCSPSPPASTRVVVGEDQILHQLRECLADRHAAGGGRVPGRDRIARDRRARRSIRCSSGCSRWRSTSAGRRGRGARGRRARWPTSRSTASPPPPGRCIGKRVLVVGAGRMARLAALAASRQGATCWSRTGARTVRQRWRMGRQRRAAPFGPTRPLPEVDAVIPAISARWPLSPARARAALARRRDAGRGPVVAAGARAGASRGPRRRATRPWTTLPAARRTSCASGCASAFERDRRGRDQFAAWVRARSTRAGDPGPQRARRDAPRRGARAPVPAPGPRGPRARRSSSR